MCEDGTNFGCNPDSFQAKVGRYFGSARESMCLTPEELAKIAALTVDEIKKLEKGEIPASPQHFVVYSLICGVNQEEFTRELYRIGLEMDLKLSQLEDLRAISERLTSLEQKIMSRFGKLNTDMVAVKKHCQIIDK